MQSCTSGRCLKFCPIWKVSGTEDSYARHCRHDFSEQLHTLGCQFWADVAKAGDIATRPRKAGDKPLPYRIAAHGHDDRDRAGCALGRGNRRRIARDDDVDFKAHQLYSELAETVGVPVSKTPFDGEILAFGPTELAQSLEERRIPQVRAIDGSAERKPSYRRHLRGGRSNRDRTREKAEERRSQRPCNLADELSSRAVDSCFSALIPWHPLPRLTSSVSGL